MFFKKKKTSEANQAEDKERVASPPKRSAVKEHFGDQGRSPQNPFYLSAFVGPIVRENRAWFVAFLLLLALIVQSLALFQLIPLKERVPYMVEVETATGRVQLADNVLKKYNVTQGNVDYFLSQWTRWIESVNERSINIELPSAASWARGSAVKQLEDHLQRTEVTKRLVKEPSRTQEAEVKTISYINEGKTALVRYDVVLRNNGTEILRTPRLLTAGVTLISPEAGSLAEKINPIGLTITSFSIANERPN
jgi:type IV secretory pathway component VirB8